MLNLRQWVIMQMYNLILPFSGDRLVAEKTLEYFNTINYSSLFGLKNELCSLKGAVVYNWWRNLKIRCYCYSYRRLKHQELSAPAASSANLFLESERTAEQIQNLFGKIALSLANICTVLFLGKLAICMFSCLLLIHVA